MRSLIQPLLMLLVRATDAELVRMVEYLKEENRVLRSKLPKRIAVTEAEKWSQLSATPRGKTPPTPPPAPGTRR